MYRQIQQYAKRLLPALVLYLITVLLSSCQSYYKIAATRQDSRSQIYSSIDSLNKLDKYFILRNGKDAFHLNIIEPGNDQDSIHCVLDSLPENHKLHLTKGVNGKMRFISDDPTDTVINGPTNAVLNEVHIYIPRDSTVNKGSYILQPSLVKNIEVIELDKKKTNTSKNVGIVASVWVVCTALCAIFVVSLFNDFQ